MKHPLSPLLVAAGLVLSAAAIAAATAPPIAGLWLSEEGDSAVEIAPCGAKLCGKLAWLKSPVDAAGLARRDIHNPEAALRSRPLCGLPIILDLESRPDGTWGGGKVYSAGTGGTYNLTVKPDGAEKLRLRGSIAGGLLGQTFYLRRAGPLPRCA